MAAPYGNKNAESWTEIEANELFDKSIELSLQKEYDFIGEIARDLGTYRDIYTYLSDKYTFLKEKHKRILQNLEANCFSHAKKGDIKEATAIVNLKSNYKWTDRADITSDNKSISNIEHKVIFEDYENDSES